MPALDSVYTLTGPNGDLIAIANGSADSQDVSSCRAEFNARMQAASVVLISETVSAALASGALVRRVQSVRLPTFGCPRRGVLNGARDLCPQCES